ncbi:hypothetical protein RhiirA4_487116 [Rhizophagus irregularis]|uniref:Uncharacterized protein n=1 Tax=Rhizophagus irregularis TaxID=588596 RepID=A0A2I1HS74_9GLOM|nr:hypothetical protein RhiirA4_487116 [Rhizophagus irregularis]
MENLRKRNEKIEIKKRNITWINSVLKTAKVDTTSISEYDKERINKTNVSSELVPEHIAISKLINHYARASNQPSMIPIDIGNKKIESAEVFLYNEINETKLLSTDKRRKEDKAIVEVKEGKKRSLEENDEETQDKIYERFLDKKGSSSILDKFRVKDKIL